MKIIKILYKMNTDAIFSYEFGPHTITLTSQCEGILLTIKENNRNIHTKSFPNNEIYTKRKIFRIKSPYEFLESNNATFSTFSILNSNVEECEVIINHLTTNITVNKKKAIDICKEKPIETCKATEKPYLKKCKPEKVEKPHLKNDEQVFSYTGFLQEFTIPSDCKSCIVECWGAGGATQGYGSNNFYNTGHGGGGAYMQVELNNLKGQTVYVLVGEGGLTVNNGNNAPQTYGGGGNQLLNGQIDWGAASAGGRTAIQLLMNGTYQDIISVAGGGAGGGNTASGDKIYRGLGSGGAGGILQGGNANSMTGLPEYGGMGSTQYSGGGNGIQQSGSVEYVYNSTKYLGAGGSQYGCGGGSGAYGGGYGGITTFGGLTSNIQAPTSTDGLVLWLDATDTSSVTVVNGVVTEWLDKSTNQAKAVPFTGSTTYANNQIGTMPAVVMNSSSLQLPLSMGTFNNGYTLFNVFMGSGNLATSRTDNTNTSYPGPWYMYDTLRYIGNSNTNSYTSIESTSSIELVNEPSIFVSQCSATNPYKDYLNGTLGVNSSAPSSNYQDTGSNIYIGAIGNETSTYDCMLGESLLFNRYLSATEINTVQNYLANKWSVTLSSSVSNNTLIEPIVDGDYFIFGGGGGGSSFVNASYGNILRSEAAMSFVAGGIQHVPDDVKGRVGNGAEATNAVKGGDYGYPGYVIFKIIR